MIKKTVLKFLLVLTVIFTIGATSIFAAQELLQHQN